MNTSLAVRDERDPFTQALALLFREGDAAKLETQYIKEMIPLVTQVAIKIGAIVTEQEIIERAVPVFTGIISLHLMHKTKGAYDPGAWKHEVANNDLQILFRKGYTLIYEIRDQQVDLTKAEKKKSWIGRPTITFTERLEEYATHRESGLWTGYLVYRTVVERFLAEQNKVAFSEWLMDATQGREVLRLTKDKAVRFMDQPDTIDPSTIIRRALYNVLHSGNPSIDMDFKKAMTIVDTARKNKTWITKAKAHYSKFLKSLEPRFQTALESEGTTLDEAVSVWNNVEWFTKKRTNRGDAIDSLCMNTGVPPPGLSKRMRADIRYWTKPL